MDVWMDGWMDVWMCGLTYYKVVVLLIAQLPSLSYVRLGPGTAVL